MEKIKCITFDKKAQDNLPQHIKDKMKADREKARSMKEHKVAGSPDKFKDIIRFIQSDLMEVKLYGNDGFDNQEKLDGKEYLVRLIKEAAGNDR